jgi:hypothetical protein
MKRSRRFICAFVCFFIFGASNAIAAGSCFNLSIGRQFCEPILERSQLLVIVGKADCPPIEAELRPFGLSPIPAAEDGKSCLVALDIFNYTSGNIGRYKELVVAYPAKTIDRASTSPEKGAYMRFLVLDSDDSRALDYAMSIGKEMYGFPKVTGKISLTFGSDRLTLNVKAESFPEISGSIRMGQEVGASEAGDGFLVATEGRSGPCWIHWRDTSRSTPYAEWEPQKNRLEIASGSPLEKVNFVPTSWSFSPEEATELAALRGHCSN